MEQRTCNIIACCKGNSRIPVGTDNPLSDCGAMHQAIAAYMSRECASPMEDYKGLTMEQILRETMFDYIDTADKPSADLRNLFCRGAFDDPTMTQRIMTMFSLVRVRRDDKLINGFTAALLEQSRKDLAEDGDPVWTFRDRHMVPLGGQEEGA